MPLPTVIGDLSTTAALNSPGGGESPALIDDYMRVAFGFIAELRDGTGTTYLRANVLGTAGLPALSFTADTDTGVFSPASDTLALATAGVERMRLDSSGNVLLGATVALAPITLGAVSAFGAGITETSTAVTAAATTNLNCSLGTVFAVAMAASITTLTFSNVPASGRAYSMTLVLNQSVGSKLVAWPASVKWASATAPTLTTTAGKSDVVTLLTVDGGTSWLAFSSLNF